MEKADIEKRISSMRKNSKENKNNSDLKNPNEKECPFRDQACNSRCKLFRADKLGYECPFQEIVPMAWNLRTLVKKLIG